jgi:hypothetical protein
MATRQDLFETRVGKRGLWLQDVHYIRHGSTRKEVSALEDGIRFR